MVIPDAPKQDYSHFLREPDKGTIQVIKNISKQWKKGDPSAPEWKYQSEDLPLANPRIGWVQHVAVSDELGRFRYDQPIVTCRPGPVCIAVDAQRNIALLRHFRPIVLDLDTPPEFPISRFDKLGVESLEFPRGGANPGELIEDAAAREAEEEVGFQVIDVKILDRSNADTAFFPISAVTCLVTIDRNQRSAAAPDPHEDTEVTFVSQQEFCELIASGKVICCQTKAAFLSYLVYTNRGVLPSVRRDIDLG
jgi:hypothetical protein